MPEPTARTALRDRITGALLSGRCCTGHIPRVADAVLPVVEAALAEQTRRVETADADTWTVTVEVPLCLPVEMRHDLATAIATAVSAWEPDDRDGWDADVYGQPTTHDRQRAVQAERERDEALAAVERVRELAARLRDDPAPLAVAYADRIEAALEQPKETR